MSVSLSFAIGPGIPSILVEVIGPFIAWSPPARHDGEILHYEVKVTSATGAYVTVVKNKMDVYHMLEREDVPSNLGRSTSVAIQVMYAYTWASSESSYTTKFSKHIIFPDW